MCWERIESGLEAISTSVEGAPQRSESDPKAVNIENFHFQASVEVCCSRHGHGVLFED